MNKPIAFGSNVLIATLEVSKDLSGGVRIKLGQSETVLSPDDASKFAEAVLQAIGINLIFRLPDKRLVAPS